MRYGIETNRDIPGQTEEKGDRTMADISEKLKDLSKQAVKLRDSEGRPWHEVASELGTSTGKAILAYEFGKVKPADRVTAPNEAAMGKKVATMRDKDGLSWGRIQARTDLGEQTLRRLYTEATGKDTLGNRIGKGGRYPGQSGKTPRKASGAKKAPAKKAGGVKKAVAKKATGVKKTAAKKATGVKKVAKKSGTATSGTTTGGAKVALVDMDLDQISERLEGRRIQVQVGDSDRRNSFQVKSVRELDGDNLSFLDAKTNNVRTIKVSGIKVASK